MAKRVEYQKSSDELSSWQPQKKPHGSHSLSKGQIQSDRINVRSKKTRDCLDEIRARLASHDEKIKQLATDQQRLARIELKMSELQRELAEIRRSKDDR